MGSVKDPFPATIGHPGTSSIRYFRESIKARTRVFF